MAGKVGPTDRRVEEKEKSVRRRRETIRLFLNLFPVGNPTLNVA